MARNFGLRGSNEIFKEFYGRGYRQFEFKKPGFSAKGYFSARPVRGAGYQNQANSTFGGNFGKMSRFLLQKLSGFQFPEDGTDVHDHLYLDPQQALSGGPYAYYLRHKSKKLLVKIPPGIRDGQQIRLAAMGQDGKGGGQPGNLLLKVHIRKPLFKSIKDFLSKWKLNL